MKFQNTNIKDCEIINYQSFPDNRGFFSTPYNLYQINDGLLMDVDFIQDNVSYSKKNVIRGLHFQTGEFEQAKLVNCFWGRIMDVVVDIRKDSPTYGNVFNIELGLGLDRMVFVPRGCAHGFSVLSDEAVLHYKVDNFYNKESESGIVYNDSDLKINWMVPYGEEIVSEKDKVLPRFVDL